MKFFLFLFLIGFSLFSSSVNFQRDDFFISLKLHSESGRISKNEIYSFLPLQIKHTERIRDDYFLLELKEPLKNKPLNKLKKTFDVRPVFKSGETRLVLSDNLVLKPKKGIDFEKTIKRFMPLSVKSYFGGEFYLVKFGKDILYMINALEKSGYFEFVVPDYYVKIKKKFTPLDNYFRKQWHHEVLKSSLAWDITKGREDVIIAIIDDGIDLRHEDLNIKAYKDFTGEGFEDSGEHGTACAGIVNAQLNNLGMVGICPNCSLVVAKIMPFSGYSLISKIVDAFQWAEGEGAYVYSNSWGFGSGFNIKKNAPVLYREIKNILENQRNGLGGVVVFASGNDGIMLGDNTIEMMDGVIGVGAVNYLNNRVYYSNYGNNLSFMAPSSTGYLGSDRDGIWTTDFHGSKGINDLGIAYQETENGREALGNDIDNEGNYTKYFGGTSAAAPMVSALAGLIFSLNKNLTRNQVFDIMKVTAFKLNDGSEVDGKSKYWGYGRIDVGRAVKYTNENIKNCSIDCENGVCVNIKGRDVCNCFAGFYLQDGFCKKDYVDVCKNINCSGNGICENIDGKAVCKCNEGFKQYGNFSCIPKEDEDGGCNFHHKKNPFLLFFLIVLIGFKYVYRSDS